MKFTYLPAPYPSYPKPKENPMSSLSVQAMIEELRQFDTPSITNVVATYPEATLSGAL